MTQVVGAWFQCDAEKMTEPGSGAALPFRCHAREGIDFLVGLTGESWTSEFAMPPDKHVNPAEEPLSTSAPGQPADLAAEGTTFMPGVLREPASRIRIQSQVMRIGRRPGQQRHHRPNGRGPGPVPSAWSGWGSGK